MKKSFTVLAAAASILQGCASYVENALVASPSADGAYYCWETRLVDSQGKYFCNWSANARRACDAENWDYLEHTAVAGEPVRLRRCENARYLVVVKTKGDRASK